MSYFQGKRLRHALVLLVASIGWAQLGSDMDQFRRLGSVDGLPSDIVFGIVQDHNGFMWFGSLAGLTRYDGHSFRVYEHRPGDPNSVADTNVGVMAVDPNEHLWVGTWGGGLDELDLRTGQMTHHPFEPGGSRSVTSDRIQSLLMSADGKRLWVGTFDGGLCSFDMDERVFQSHLNGDERIWSIAEQEGGSLWMGSDEGLIHLDVAQGQHELIQFEMPDQPTPTVTAVLIDDAGRILCGTMNGVQIYDPATRARSHLDLGNVDPQPNVRHLLKDSRGYLWLATYGQGLICFRPETHESKIYRNRARDHKSLSHDRVERLFEDRSGVLWIATSGGGINVFNLDPKPFHHVFRDPDASDTMSHNDVSGFTKTPDGTLWVGTFGGGLCAFRNGNWESFVMDPKDPTSLSDNTIRALELDAEGNIWVATYRGGLNKKVPGRPGFVRFMHDPRNARSPLSNTMRALLWDSRERLWIGTDRGLDLMSGPGDFVHITFDENPFGGPGLTHPRILALSESTDGSIWVGTENGLVVLNQDGSHRSSYVADPNDSLSLAHSRVFSLLSDRSGRNWIGTGFGLCRFRDDGRGFDRFMSPLSKHVSVSNQIMALLEDGQGRIWVSSPAGLSRFDPETEEFRGFDIDDGLQSPTFNQGSGFHDLSGTMFFGGTNGFNYFDPDAIVDHPFIPPVVITQVDVLREAVYRPFGVDTRPHVKIPWEDREVVFHYAALDFAYADRNQYAYMLEGYHDDWVEVGNAQSAPFMNLSPGDYTFKVKGTNRDGIWNPKHAQFRLIVVPPFWQTPWFISLCVLGLVALAAWRVRDVRGNTLRLESTVRERTEKLEKTNNELRQTAIELQEAQERLILSAHQAGMAEIATGVLHNIGNLLNSVNVSSQEIEKRLRSTKLQSLKKVNDLIRNQQDNLVEAIAQHPKAESMLRFYLQLERVLEEENLRLVEEVDQLSSKVKLMSEVIATQQSYAKTPMFTESVDIRRLFDDALKLEQTALDRDHVSVVKEYEDIPICWLPRVKLMQMFTNLIKNAREAMIHQDTGSEKKCLRIRIYRKGAEMVVVEIEDNGVGIQTDKKELIFNYGYSTKQGGHGFGLHASAIAMSEIGGAIYVESSAGQGSVFRLEFPVGEDPSAG